MEHFSTIEGKLLPLEELVTRCTNDKCLRMFHLVPSDTDVAMFNEILADPHARGPMWMRLECPVCKHTFQRLAPALTHCSCGVRIHPEEIPAETPPAQ